MNIDSLLDDLARNVIIKEGGFSLSTENISGAEYAYYLISSKETVKRFYTSENNCFIPFEISPGFFSAIFYYRIGGNKKVRRLDFLVKEDFSVLVPEKRKLYESKNSLIEHYDLNSNVTFAVFNGIGSTKNSIPFGLGFLIKKGYNVLACYQDNDSQYQDLSVESFYESVSNVLEGKRAFTYGASLGGYCAAYYAGVINATVICSAPRNSAHPLIRKSKKDSRFGSLLFKHKEKISEPLTKKRVYCFIDPYHISDVYFYRDYIAEAYPEAYLYEIPHSGHEVLYYLNDTKQLSNIVDKIVKDENFQVDVDKESFYTNLGLCKHWLLIGDPLKSKKYLDKALSNEILASGMTKKIENLDKNIQSLRNKLLRGI